MAIALKPGLGIKRESLTPVSRDLGGHTAKIKDPELLLEAVIGGSLTVSLDLAKSMRVASSAVLSNACRRLWLSPSRAVNTS